VREFGRTSRVDAFPAHLLHFNWREYFYIPYIVYKLPAGKIKEYILAKSKPKIG
jgi:hypothetical protein